MNTYGRLAPMIYVVFLERWGTHLPPYFADAPPDLCAITALPAITDGYWRLAWLRYD